MSSWRFIRACSVGCRGRCGKEYKTTRGFNVSENCLAGAESRVQCSRVVDTVPRSQACSGAGTIIDVCVRPALVSAINNQPVSGQPYSKADLLIVHIHASLHRHH